MRHLLELLTVVCAVICISVSIGNAQSTPDQNKTTITYEEAASMCGLIVDPAVMAATPHRVDSLYALYLSRRSQSGARPLVLSVNWTSMMGPVENQMNDSCILDCWTHSAAGVTEGQLHILYGSNVGINIREMEIVDNVLGHCDGNTLDAGLNYIKTQRAGSDVGSYPNLQGASWSIKSYTQVIGPDDIENALQYGPVTAGFTHYQDFDDFFNNPQNATKVYQYNGTSKWIGNHAVVIVGYDDAAQYWLCKNSYGSGWADNGYFRIHMDVPGHITGIDSYANYSVTVDQSCYAKIVPNLISSLSTALGYSFWGKGNEITYVLGTTTTSSDATVPFGATLQLSPGVTIQAANGVVLYINGQLIANGSSSQPITFDRSGTSGSWNSLALQSGSSANLSYCTFNHASTGLTCNSSNVTITNCTFTNCTGGVTCASGAAPSISNCSFSSDYFGFYIVGSSPTITSNDIENCTNSGIYLSGASPTISSNTIKNNSSYGIYCHSSSSPWISGNTISANSTAGLYCDYYSSPSLATPAFPGYNVIANNGEFGVDAYYYSNPVLGNSQIWGDNSVFGNASCDVYTNFNCTVLAWHNWWGVYPPNSNKFCPNGSTIDYSYAFTSNPNPGRPKIAAPQIASPTSDSTFNLAYFDAINGQFDDAVALYFKVLSMNPLSAQLTKQALVFLAEAYERSGKTDFINYLQNQITPKIATSSELMVIVRELEGHWLVKAGKYSDALTIFQGLHTDFASNPDIDKFALFNIGELYQSYLGDHASAVEALTVFQSKYPKDPLASVANFLMSITVIPSVTSPLKGGGTTASIVLTPEGFELSSNYPNPFNPSTQLTYSLPQAGKVSLVIYDVLGREVATLADAYQQSGRYSVTWNSKQNSGIPVSSGVYFARLRVLNDLGRVTFTKTTKLLLMK